MAIRRLRICSGCGNQEETFSKSPICNVCHHKSKLDETRRRQQCELEDLGYEVLGVQQNKYGHNVFTLKTPCCSSIITPTHGNVFKQFNLYGKPPCTICGGKERMSKAMTAYVEKHGANYDLAAFEDYQKKVRKMSARTYEAYKHVINPQNYPRGRSAGFWHLDHKVPIIWCFKNDVPPEVAAGLQNLQMLPVVENLQKSGKLLNDEEARQILRESVFSNLLFTELGDEFRDKIEVVADTANIWSTENKMLVREGEIKRSLKAVVSRIRYKYSNVREKVGARKLEIRSVPFETVKSFLDEWHIQGSTTNPLKAYGLFRGAELISVMTFGRPRYKQSKAEWELIRFCSRGDVTVSGGAGKLFNHFLKECSPKAIISYSLNRWGSGDTYRILGFKQIAEQQSTCSYLWRGDQKIRSWRASILRARKYGIQISSGEIAGTLKIHDMGSKTWLWEQPENKIEDLSS